MKQWNNKEVRQEKIKQWNNKEVRQEKIQQWNNKEVSQEKMRQWDNEREQQGNEAEKPLWSQRGRQWAKNKTMKRGNEKGNNKIKWASDSVNHKVFETD